MSTNGSLQGVSGIRLPGQHCSQDAHAALGCALYPRALSHSGWQPSHRACLVEA